MQSDFQFSQQFEESEEEDNAPLTTSEKLLAEVKEIENVLLTGNTHRYVMGGLGVFCAVGSVGLAAAAGVVAISPIPIAGLGVAAVFAGISYASYVQYEGILLNIVPAFIPLESGKTEDIEQYLPKYKKALYKAIARFGTEVLNQVEEQGQLKELVQNINKIQGGSFASARKDAEKAWNDIENYYITPLRPQTSQQQRLAPQTPRTPSSPQAQQYRLTDSATATEEEDDDEVNGLGETIEDEIIDLWDNEETALPLKAASNSSLAIATSTGYDDSLLKTTTKQPLKVISFSQIEKAASPIYQWKSIASAHHLMLIGNTGSGKSTLVKWIVETFCQDASLMILDPHAGYGDWGNLEVIGQGRDYVQIAEAFDFLLRNMNERYQIRAKQKKAQFDKLFVVVDEFAAIASSTKGLSEIALLIAAEGRKVNIILCLLSQGESVKTLKIEGQSEMKQNFTFIRLGAFAKKQAQRMGLETVAGKYDRYCFVEDQLAPLPDLTEFESTISASSEELPQLSLVAAVDEIGDDTEEDLPIFTATDLSTYLKLKRFGTYPVSKLSANLSRKGSPVTVSDVMAAAEELEEGGSITLINWEAKQGRAILFENPNVANQDNVLIFPIQIC